MNERYFPTRKLGERRDRFLTDIRIELRGRVNPETGVPWTEDDIARGTAPGTPLYARATGFDLALMGEQARAVWLSRQVVPWYASSEWLEEYHGRLWIPGGKLPGSGGSGAVTATAPPGTWFVGSTTIGDPTAAIARDEAGNRYQALLTAQADPNGIATVLLVGLNTGDETNLDAGEKLTWIQNVPIGADINGVEVIADFRGGTPPETDSDYLRRLQDAIRYREASGNRAQFRAWARQASNAILDGFVNACAYHSGSVHVSIVQKRGTAKGPFGRIPSVGTIAAAIGYLVPPSSPVVPAQAYVVVSSVEPVFADPTLLLAMPRGSSPGWMDPRPWPLYQGAPALVTSIISPTVFRFAASSAPPVAAPRLMVWNVDISEFEALSVSSVTSIGGGIYQANLSAPPAVVIAIGDRVSPRIGRAVDVAAATVDYFDSLGPGELIDLETDDRAHRAHRFPVPSEAWPSRAGRGVLNFLSDALGPLLADSDIDPTFVGSPAIPTEPIFGPKLITCGRVGAYPL
jgi:hypothetical protein